MAGIKWLESEINFVKENYHKMTCEEMAHVLGRTKRALQHLSANLKLKREANIGEKFGRLTIIEKFIEYKYNQNITFVICKCECGKTTKQKLTSISSNRIVSCGCWKAEKARERTIKRNKENGYNGRSFTRLYSIYHGMINRCYRQTDATSYANYGGRGIKICKEWLDNFENFEKWALDNGYNENLSIDRIDVNGNYEPSNCRWATKLMQSINRRNTTIGKVMITAFGQTKTTTEWLKDQRCTLKQVASLIYRINRGMCPEEAISKQSERPSKKIVNKETLDYSI